MAAVGGVPFHAGQQRFLLGRDHRLEVARDGDVVLELLHRLSFHTASQETGSDRSQGS
jgi:hypothetical protein